METERHPGLPSDNVIEGWYVHHDGQITWHEAAQEQDKDYCIFYVRENDAQAKIGFFGVDFFPTTMPDAEEEAHKTAHANAFCRMIDAQARMRHLKIRLEQFAEKSNG
ncbi:MAG: hypothetical protein ACXWQ5_00565 [Ktedonobacterales bacterium]